MEEYVLEDLIASHAIVRLGTLASSVNTILTLVKSIPVFMVAPALTNQEIRDSSVDVHLATQVNIMVRDLSVNIHLATQVNIMVRDLSVNIHLATQVNIMVWSLFY
jgi:hypothetical protein